MSRACSTNGVKRSVYGILVGKRPLGKPRRRWVNDIKMDLRDRGWGGTDSFGLAQDRDQWRALVSTIRTFGLHKMF
jgi:hypothetical protein